MTGMRIRTRIVLWFLGLTALLLAVFSASVLQRTHTERIEQLDRALAERALAIAALAERDHGRWEVELDGALFTEESEGAVSSAKAPTFSYAVSAWPDGRVLAHSSSLGVEELEAPAPEALLESEAGPEGRPRQLALHAETRTSPDGRAFRVAVGVFTARADEESEGDDESLPETPEEPALVKVVVAEDLAAILADRRNLARNLGLLGLLTLALAAGAGALLSKRIVDPIATLAHTAEEIRTSGSAKAVPTLGTGDELDALATVLNEAFSRLVEAYDRQARFTADASHELRTPLAVIRTQAEVALRRSRTAEEYQAALSSILGGADRMQNTLEALLILARADSGAGRPATDPVDLGSVVEAAAEEVEPLAREAGVEISRQVPPDCVVRGDAQQLRILVRNLLSNAVQHGGASVTRVCASVHREAATIMLEVSDNGVGIAPDELDHVVERFYRVDLSRSRARGGAGLGLSLVDVIARQHGAVLVMESTPGIGTTARVTFESTGAEVGPPVAS